MGRERLDGLDGCLIRTERKKVVHLGKNLPTERRAWVVCHELAHLLLDHLPDSSYLFDPQRLDAGGVAFFERQERQADALASLWMHLFQGLVELYRPGHEDCWWTPARSAQGAAREPEPAARHPAIPAFGTGKPPPPGDT